MELGGTRLDHQSDKRATCEHLSSARHLVQAREMMFLDWRDCKMNGTRGSRRNDVDVE